MAPFSVAQLKEKALNAKSTGSDKFQSVRDKYTNRSSTESSYSPSTKAPPPPQTSYGGSQVTVTPSTARKLGPPPPIRRSTRPSATPRIHKDDYSGKEFSWSSINPEDKRLLFSWLDEFFEAKGRSHGKSTQNLESDGRNESSSSVHQEVQRSAAQDLSSFFSPNIRWETPWYTSQDRTPPPLLATTDGIRTHSIQRRGDTWTLSGGILFSDLSACWYTVTWTEQHASDTTHARRSTVFAPRPDAQSREELLVAHETYGETVAAFAEGYEGTGQWCARGECWDLASEALKAFEQWDYVPKPLPSIGTCHGHLIYEGSVRGNNAETGQMGRWRGEDDHIRRGDIVQWKSVKIIDGNRRFTLGEPDHTAIIVCDQQPLMTPLNGQALSPSKLGSIEVVEQSVHSPPARQVYNLGGMVSGDVWIYRPVGMEAYLKFTFGATSPEGFRFATVN